MKVGYDVPEMEIIKLVNGDLIETSTGDNDAEIDGLDLDLYGSGLEE